MFHCLRQINTSFKKEMLARLGSCNWRERKGTRKKCGGSGGTERRGEEEEERGKR